jgi:hypothetical protein
VAPSKRRAARSRPRPRVLGDVTASELRVARRLPTSHQQGQGSDQLYGQRGADPSAGGHLPARRCLVSIGTGCSMHCLSRRAASDTHRMSFVPSKSSPPALRSYWSAGTPVDACSSGPQLGGWEADRSVLPRSRAVCGGSGAALRRAPENSHVRGNRLPNVTGCRGGFLPGRGVPLPSVSATCRPPQGSPATSDAYARFTVERQSRVGRFDVAQAADGAQRSRPHDRRIRTRPRHLKHCCAQAPAFLLSRFKSRVPCVHGRVATTILAARR